MTAKSLSGFRLWIQKMYWDCCEEHRLYNDPVITAKEYWQAHKYWLKRRYREYIRNTARIR